MIAQAVPVHQIDEILLGVARQRRLAEVGVGREEGVGAGLMVGEVAAPPPLMRILRPGFLALSSTSTERPR